MSTAATALAPETAPGCSPRGARPAARVVASVLAPVGDSARTLRVVVSAAWPAWRLEPRGAQWLLVAVVLLFFVASVWSSTPLLAVVVLPLLVPLASASRRVSRVGVGVMDGPRVWDERAVHGVPRAIALLDEAQAAMVDALVRAVEARDAATHGHGRRVQALAMELALRMGMSDPEELQALSLAALLHDVGKLEVPEAILNKPAALTEAEMAVMRRHAEAGAAMLVTLGLRSSITSIVRHHHERWDGSGYPSGLAGTAIPLGARILAVADCYDALTSDRPYRAALPTEQARVALLERRWTMYDAKIICSTSPDGTRAAPR